MSVDTPPRTRARRGRHSPRKFTKKTRKKKGFFRRWWWVIVGVPLLGIGVVAGTLIWVYVHLELPATLPPIQSTYLYDRDGQLLTTLHGAVDRTVVPLGRVPDTLQHAVLAAEDDAFYDHPGVDPLGIARAAWTDLVARDTVQGGSTITQQVVKNVYAGTYQTDANGDATYVIPPRTIGQKVREGLLAVKLESEQTKDQILATYLNTVYFGHGAYGVQAAAKTYFDRDVGDLNVQQAALLAGLVRSPGSYDPIPEANRQAAQDRRNYVLGRMAANGWLSGTRADTLEAEPVKVRPADETFNTPGDSEYFVDYSKRALTKRYGGPEVFGGGLRVTTTIDLRLQQAAEKVVQAHLPTKGDPSAAVVTIDVQTGQVLTMVGGTDFARSQVNLATGDGGTGRQAGSAFKPFTLATAMEHRFDLSAYWSGPSSITISNKECYTDGKPWTLSNASDEESGTFTLAKATAYSVNTVFAQVMAELGPDQVVNMAHRLGIRSPLGAYCAATLGTEAVTPLEMTNAYATLAAHGVRRYATPLIAVTDRRGHPVPDGKGNLAVEPKAKQVLSSNDADLVTSALQGVVQFGTGTAANLGRPMAGKTGTAQDYVDAWFCGYTPQLATCVWMGYPKGEISMGSVEGVSPVYGGTIPASIWHDYMAQALAILQLPSVDFAVPSTTGYDVGPPTPAPVPTSPPTASPSTSPSPKPSPTPSPSDKPSPTPSATPSPTTAPVAPPPGRRFGAR